MRTAEEDNIIYLSEEDEEAINNSPHLEEKKIIEEEDVEDLPQDSREEWTPPRHLLIVDYPGYYYNEYVEDYLPLSSWEDVPLQVGEVFPHLLGKLERPATPSGLSSSDPKSHDQSHESDRNQSETRHTRLPDLLIPSQVTKNKAHGRGIHIHLPTPKEHLPTHPQLQIQDNEDAASIPWTHNHRRRRKRAKTDEIEDFGNRKTAKKKEKGENDEEDTLSQLSLALSDTRNYHRGR